MDVDSDAKPILGRVGRGEARQHGTTMFATVVHVCLTLIQDSTQDEGVELHCGFVKRAPSQRASHTTRTVK